MKKILRPICTCIIIVTLLGVISLLFRNRNALYSVVNHDISLSLNAENSEIVSYCCLDGRDAIYIIEFGINESYKNILQQQIKSSGQWIKTSQLSASTVQRYVLNYVDILDKYADEFSLLRTMAVICQEPDNYFYLHVDEENQYSVKFCAAVLDSDVNRLYYFRW